MSKMVLYKSLVTIKIEVKEAEEFDRAWCAESWKWQGRQKGQAKVRRPDPVEGETYTGKITSIQAFGVFVGSAPEDGSRTRGDSSTFRNLPAIASEIVKAMYKEPERGRAHREVHWYG
jgi:hypothetical protein